MMGCDLSALLRIRNLAGLCRSSRDLHSSRLQCLRSNTLSLSAVPVKLAYASYESINGTIPNAKEPVIIMHGLFGSKNNWNSLSKAIHQKTNRKVITVDARNHGDSPHSSTMSYKDMAEDVVQLLADLSLRKAILVGHSMGGSAMMMTALTFPHYVEKLVVVDMSPVRTSPSLSQMTTIFEAMRSIMVDGSPTLSKARKVVDQQLAKYIKSMALRQFLTTNLVEADSGKYKWRVNLSVLEQAFPTQIATFPNVGTRTFTGPTSFIGGADSDYIRIEDHKAIKKLFPTAEFRYINGANHWVHADKPAEFVDLLTNFINRSS